MRYGKVFTTATFINRAKRKADAEDMNLVGAAKELAKDMAVLFLLRYGLALLLVIALLVILGFTELLGGPFVLAQVLLFLVVGSTILMVAAGWWLYRKGRQKLTEFARQSESTDQSKDVTETTVIDGTLE